MNFEKGPSPVWCDHPKRGKCECAARKRSGLVFFMGRWRTRAAAVARVLSEPAWRGAELSYVGNEVIAKLGRARATFPGFEDPAAQIGEILALTK